VARGGDAINGRAEPAHVDVPADVLVDCVCLVVREGAGKAPEQRRAGWAYTQLDESGVVSRLVGEAPAAAASAA